MLKRIITAIILICVLIPIFIFSNTWIFPIAVAICSAIGIFELLRCIGQKKNLFLMIPLCAVAAFLPLYARFVSLKNGGVEELLKLGVGIAFVMSLYILGVAVFANKSVNITDAGLLLSVSIYVIAAFTSLVYLHDYIPYGSYIYLLTFICAWIADAGAYFTGILLGKHKLIPAVSPKKTVEGAIGGIVFGTLAMVLFGFIVVKFFNNGGITSANYGVLIVAGIFASVVSQTGDLIMSVIKRHYGIKDYGNLFPGHGGVLDRFDSVFAVSLILSVICTYFDLLTFL